MFGTNRDKKLEFFAFPPIKEEVVDLFKASVSETFKIKLTDEFINVLKISNGFMVDNFILYGSKPLDRNTYSIPDIFSANERFTKSNIQGKLILGSFLNYYLIMDWVQPEKYFLINNFGVKIVKEFSSFTDALEFIKEAISD